MNGITDAHIVLPAIQNVRVGYPIHTFMKRWILLKMLTLGLFSLFFVVFIAMQADIKLP